MNTVIRPVLLGDRKESSELIGLTSRWHDLTGCRPLHGFVDYNARGVYRHRMFGIMLACLVVCIVISFIAVFCNIPN